MGELFLFVKLAGAGYLIWLGVKLWRARIHTTAEGRPMPERQRGFGVNALAGLTLTLGNPKPIAFYAGLLPPFIDLEKLTAGEMAIMMLIMLPVGRWHSHRLYGLATTKLGPTPYDLGVHQSNRP